MWRKLLVSKISRNVVQNRPSETQQVALITLSMDSINRNRWKKKHKMTIMAEKNGETAQAWLSAWSNQPQQEWRFLSGGKVAMCFKSFLHVCDKGCHHRLCFPNLVWPNTRTFHPSHVSALTLDPNWPLLRQERLVYPAQVFKFCLWNLTVPRGFLLPGWGIENWQTQKTRVPVLALMAGPSNRISRLSSSGWTKPHSWQVTRRANSTSKELSFQPVSKLREQEWGLCSHLNTYKAKLS